MLWGGKTEETIWFHPCAGKMRHLTHLVFSGGDKRLARPQYGEEVAVDNIPILHCASCPHFGLTHDELTN